jgi:hypothetical protein
LKISRSSVREALLMLENEDLVTCDNSLGYITKKLSTSEVIALYVPSLMGQCAWMGVENGKRDFTQNNEGLKP